MPAGTVLTVFAWGSEKNLRYVFYANGKLFETSGENGSKYMWTDKNYLPELTATDGSTVLYYTTSPDGSGEHYAAGRRNDDLPKGTKLYAQWLQEGSIITRITDGANNTLDRRSMKPGETLTLPAPETAPTGLKFAKWYCYYEYYDAKENVKKTGKLGNDGIVEAGGTLTIPDNAVAVYATAQWDLVKKVKVSGVEVPLGYDIDKAELKGLVLHFYPWNGRIKAELSSYRGGSIETPAQTDVFVRDGIESIINGTLSCDALLYISTECAYGRHSGLRIEADPGKPAIYTPYVRFDRVPHLTLNGGDGARAITGPNGRFGSFTHGCEYWFGSKTSSGTKTELDFYSKTDGERPGDMQILETEPQMSKLTINGNGGKTTDGKTSTTVDLEYGEGYSLRATGFKKQYSDVVGFVENTGDDTYHYYEWPKSIRVQSPAVTLKINWRELGYPYLAFRADGALKGDGIDNTWTSVSYVNRNEKPEVLASDYVYADAVSNGDLVYWFSSEDGTETDSSRQYLAGEVVSEPDDTTLYARAIRWGQVALVAPGTTFSNGKHVVVSSTLDTTLTSKEGKTIESWNTKPDGTGRTYNFTDKLEYETPRILYAQWKTKLEAAVTETTTTETVVTFTPKAGESVRIEATNENDAAVLPEQARRVILAAYRNGQFLGMLPATAETGKIICRIPNDAKYDGCELKLFFMEGGKPKQDMEIIRLPAE